MRYYGKNLITKYLNCVIIGDFSAKVRQLEHEHWPSVEGR